MKSLFKNRTLTIALAVSVAAHAALLAVRFAAPEAFRFKPVDPGLEVILVNARHEKKPLKAEALAQANLDGGGNADAGRAQSPLPDARKVENGDHVKASRRRQTELEERQRRLLAQSAKKTPLAAPAPVEKEQAQGGRARRRRSGRQRHRDRAHGGGNQPTL